MSDHMDEFFVKGFVEVCEAAGLTKEAAASLLHRQSIIEARKSGAPFAEGFEKVASEHLGTPVFDEAWLTKEAKKGFKRIISGIKDLFGGGTDVIKKYTPSTQTVKRTGGHFHKHRGKYIAGGGLAGMAGVYGLTRLDTKDSMYFDSPFEVKGEEDYTMQMEKRLRGYEGEINNLNSNYLDSFGRRKELERMIAAGTATPNLKSEYKTLQDQHTSYDTQRKDYMKTIATGREKKQEYLKNINSRREELEGSRDAWYRKPVRFWDWMNREDPDARIDKQLGDLDAKSSRLQFDIETARKRNAMVAGGYTLPTVTKPEKTPQERFFRTL